MAAPPLRPLDAHEAAHQNASKLPQCSFAGIAIPYESIDVDGSLRDHVHEYPHVGGGAAEKLGRKLGTAKIVSNFSSRFRLYPNLWPRDLDRLVKLFETETTEQLVIPQLPSGFPAYCFKWNRHIEAKVRSGEKVTLEFREDQNQDFLTDALETVSTGETLVDRQAQLDRNLIAIRMNYRSQRERDIFDRIRTLTNSIAAVGDRADLAAGILDSRLAQLSEMCALADRLPQLGGAEAFPAVEPLHAIWEASVRMREDILSRGARLKIAIVPQTMSVTQVAAWLGLPNDRAEDLIALNASITDPARVTAGTSVKYYP